MQQGLRFFEGAAANTGFRFRVIVRARVSVYIRVAIIVRSWVRNGIRVGKYW